MSKHYFVRYADPVNHINGAVSFGTHVVTDTPFAAKDVVRRLGNVPGEVIVCDDAMTCSHSYDPDGWERIEHYIVSPITSPVPPAMLETGCGRTIPTYPAPREGAPRCAECAILVESGVVE